MSQKIFAILIKCNHGDFLASLLDFTDSRQTWKTEPGKPNRENQIWSLGTKTFDFYINFFLKLDIKINIILIKLEVIVNNIKNEI